MSEMPSRTHKTVLVAVKTNCGSAECTFSWSTVPLSCCCNNYCVNMIKKTHPTTNKQHLLQPRSISEMFFATIIVISRYVFMLICQLSVYIRLIEAMCHGGEIVWRWRCVCVNVSGCKIDCCRCKRLENVYPFPLRAGKRLTSAGHKLLVLIANSCSNYRCI